ncbi:MAG: hypothetical protein LBQ79_05215, partial [Deltaproteobacteria bacterium]|nr:hypothetical protein [Deltaproteobacteria bacterium]
WLRITIQARMTRQNGKIRDWAPHGQDGHDFGFKYGAAGYTRHTQSLFGPTIPHFVFCCSIIKYNYA